MSSGIVGLTPITIPSNNESNSVPLMKYLRKISGQEKKISLVDVEHNYSKLWNIHPDPNIKSRPARFLFLSFFHKNYDHSRLDEEIIDVESVEENNVNPFITEANALQSANTPNTPSSATINLNLTNDDNSESDSDLDSIAPNKQGWSSIMNRIWTKMLRILNSDRLTRLTFTGLNNELILKKNLNEKTCNKFRQVFASIANWDVTLLNWLNSTLLTYIPNVLLNIYHEAMQLLRQKLPSLIDKFYSSPKNDSSGNLTRNKTANVDPILAVLNNHKPKRILGSPLFLIVPSGPLIPHSLTSQRMKHWNNLFGSLGKVITVTVSPKLGMRAGSCLNEIRFAVRDKIKECKATFSDVRPLILVGFGASSLIAAHCALQNYAFVQANICLGFPLTGVNGFRGDLDDPLLETTVPTLFIIGQNSTMCTLDDMEDFRERITRTETGLVVVGGTNDRLILSDTKKRYNGITQAMVDRCICDEISDFINCIINPNYNSDTLTTSRTNLSQGLTKQTSNINKSLNASTPVKRKKRKTEESLNETNVQNENKSETQRDKNVSPTPTKKKSLSESHINPPTNEKKTIDSTQISKILPTNTAQATLPLKNEPPLNNTTVNTSAATVITAKGNSGVNTSTNIQVTPPPSSSSSATIAQSTMNADDNLSEVDQNIHGTERHYGWSYGVSEVPTVISSGTTRTRHIKPPKQLDI